MVHSPDVTQSPITTSTYALEFQKAIEQSSHGRQILFIQVLSQYIYHPLSLKIKFICNYVLI